jgi:hypothetical protein
VVIIPAKAITKGLGISIIVDFPTESDITFFGAAADFT